MKHPITNKAMVTILNTIKAGKTTGQLPLRYSNNLNLVMIKYGRMSQILCEAVLFLQQVIVDKFHLKSAVNLNTNKNSKQVSSLEELMFIVIGEKSRSDR